uniref:Single domain-containing protein n=1 Tax=Rhipicephalus appendiculatus TaxID=34631 RepID=A0A131YU43_RHIAP
MKLPMEAVLILLATSLPFIYQHGDCPDMYQEKRPCGSAGIVESTCPGVGRPWCRYYNYVSFRRRPCGCMPGACRHRNMSCVLCSKCDNCTYKGIELPEDNYTYFNASCERAICSFGVGIVLGCTNAKPEPYGSCIYTRESGRYPRCCNWVRTC